MKEIILALIAIIPPIATLIVSIITNKKVKKQNDLRQEMKECEERIEKKLNILNDKIDNVAKKNDKNRKKELCTILANEYTALNSGRKRSKEQKQNIANMFEEYKELGGDSFIDDLHDIWKEKEGKK